MEKVHTMEELHFTGNALKGSRPLLSFDATFVTYGEGHISGQPGLQTGVGRGRYRASSMS